MSLEYLSQEVMEGKSKEELIALLIRAQQKHKQLLFQLQEAKVSQVELQNQAEAEEELIANTLFKKLEQLEAQKNNLLQQVEQEEEYLTNTLQKKLHDLELDKTRLEERLEEEQEYIVNKLTKQLDEVLAEKTELQKQIDEANRSTEELRKTKLELKKLKEEAAKSIEDLKQQNFLLQQQADQQKQKLESINRQKGQLEQEIEVENEKQFNLGSSPNKTKMLKAGVLLMRSEPAEPFRELHFLLSARGILLAFTDADYLAGHTDPEVKIVLDKVTAVSAVSTSGFLLRTNDGHEFHFKSVNEDPKEAMEWRELISSLIP